MKMKLVTPLQKYQGFLKQMLSKFSIKCHIATNGRKVYWGNQLIYAALLEKIAYSVVQTTY